MGATFQPGCYVATAPIPLGRLFERPSISPGERFEVLESRDQLALIRIEGSPLRCWKPQTHLRGLAIPVMPTEMVDMELAQAVLPMLRTTGTDALGAWVKQRIN
jgi:hypothetical protein